MPDKISRFEFEYESSLPGIGIGGSRYNRQLVAEYQVKMEDDTPTINIDDVQFYVELDGFAKTMKPNRYRKGEIENVLTIEQWRALKKEMIAQWRREQEEASEDHEQQTV